MNILIIRSKDAGVTRGFGEFARLRAVANVLSEGGEVAIGEAHVIDLAGVRPFIAACLRVPSFRRSIRHAGTNHPIFKGCLRHLDLPDEFQPELLLTTLAPRIVPGALIATLYSCHWVHVGDVPRYWDYLYSCKIVTAVESPTNQRNTVFLDFLTTSARKKQTKHYNTSRIIATLAIGWNVRELGYFYRKEDFLRLFKAIANLSRTHDVEWNITTSPRSSVDMEMYLEELVALFKIPVRRVTWYRRKPEKSLAEMLDFSDFAFVTEDSRSMISDAVASSTPLFTIRPDENNSIKPGHHKFVSSLEHKKFLKRLTFDDVGDVDLHAQRKQLHVIEECWSERLRSGIHPYLMQTAILS